MYCCIPVVRWYPRYIPYRCQSVQLAPYKIDALAWAAGRTIKRPL